MQNVLRVHTKVLTGGKVEVVSPELLPGQSVELIILLSPPDISPEEERPSVLEILDNASGHQVFHTAEEVEQYLVEEHGAWQP